PIEIPWRRIALWGWFTASLLLAARLLVTFGLGIRLLRNSRPFDRLNIQRAADFARAKLGVARPVQVLCSERTRTPIIWCWARRPVLLVPGSTRQARGKVDWISVLCHELAHFKRRDHITGLVAELAVAIFPWHPLLWWAKRRLVRLSEQACDDWVLATGRPGPDYAESLLDLLPARQMAFAPAVISSKKGLARRVRRILQDNCGNPRAGLLWALTASTAALAVATAIAFAQTRPAKPETPPVPTLSEVRELVKKNETAAERIKMDYTLRFERTGEKPEPTGRAGSRKRRPGRSYSHCTGTWAQNGVKQYAATDYFYGPNERAKGHLHIFDGRVVKRANRPDLTQWVISDISTFDWDAVSVVKLGLRPFEALNKLSAVLVPEYGSVRDKPDSVDGREAYVIDAIRPTGHVYFARIWIDAERGMPSKIEYYDQHPDSGGARLMSRIDSIKLHQLPNRAWVPVKGTRSLFFQNGGIIREHMSVDVLSIRTDPDVPDSLFSFEFPEGAKIYDVTTGHTFIQGQPQKTIDQVLQAAPKFIAGRVVDSNNVPVSGVVVKTVFHLTKSEDGKRGFRIINGHDRLSYITDNQGRFALQLEQDDSYDITFSSKNHAGFIAYDVPSGTGDLKVVLPEGGTVTGRVVRLENGRKVPVASVEVTAEHRLGNFTRLGFENNKKTITDSQGRFRFDHLRTRMRRYKRRSLNEEHTYVPRSWKISAEGTSTTIEFRDTEKIEEMELVVTADLGTPLPLLGKPLPQFGGINIQFNAKQTGDEKVLVCFWDMNQRPSRYCIRQLAERASHLKDKGVNIVAIQAAAVDENALNEWISKNHIPFPVGNIKADEEKTRLAWGVRSLPWLILTDTDHIVTAEGFQVNELAEQISAGAENPDPSPARAAPATPDTVSLANRKRAYEHYEGDDLIQRIKSRDQMDPESLITVRTLDHQGDPVPYCRITFVDRDEKTTRHFYETATDQNGYAYCDQIQDTFSIIAGAFDYVPETAVYRSQDRKIGTLYNCQDNRLVTVQWPPFPTGPGKVKGRVHDQYGQPLTKFKLQINQRKGERQDWSESYETFQYLEVEHPQGHFQLTDLAPGKYVCGVRAKYLAAYASQYDMDEFVIPEAPQAAVHKDIEVEAKELLYGQAVYQDGSPLEKGGYTLWFEKDPPERRSRWGGRRFSLRMEPHGVFRVALSRRERRDLFQCTGGYVDIRDHSGKIGQVHVDKLAKDPNNAPTFEFARKTPRHSLVGARMPKFADIDIDFTPDQAMGKPILVCFWDMNQRPSRYLLKELAEKAEDLKQHGLEVVCVQASIVNQKELDDWVEKNYMPFPVGMVRSNDKTTRFNWGAKSLPWLILTDKEHVVRAEGFGLEELDKRIKANRSNPVARAQTPPVKDLRLEGVPASTEEDYYKQAWKVFQGYDLNTLITSRDQKDPESLVTVRTVDHQGNPVPFCRIVFADRNKYSSHPFRETAADKDGYVYCDQIGGDFSIRAGAFYYVADTNVYRYEHKRMPKLYNAKDKPVITVRWDAFPTGTGKIRGAVADQFGKPLKKFTLKINQIIKGQRRGKGEFHIAYHRIKVEHPQGHFQLADLAPGTYTYTVRAEDYLAYVSEFDMGQFTIPLQPNSTLKLDIEVEARACLYGQAVYDDGTMLRKGGFTLWGPEESRDYIYTIPPGGRFRVCLSRLEREELLASNQGYIFIRDASRDLGKIHIDKLSKDANNPPTFAFARREPRDSLVGVPMPKFADIDIDFTPDQARGKPILVCFWDMNQRPSRYLIKELAKKQERLKQDGLEVVCVQAS
ncbi:MAG: M56 family metallopeptidase, partial [Planctomycetota bacterium]